MNGMGAISSAKDIGVSSEEVASTAAHGSLRAADQVGSKTLGTVRHAVTRKISGVKVVVEEPFKAAEKK